MNDAMRDRIEKRVSALAIERRISTAEARKLLNQRAGRKSAATRREKLLSQQPTLPVFHTEEAPSRK